MLLIIDNYDSFTYNIVQTVAGSCKRLGLDPEIQVFRNDKITLDGIEALAPARILISPGPCTPREAGISIDVIRRFAGTIPILGVCLGHQSIGEAFGGKTVRASRIMHGKTSMMHHDCKGIFTGIENPFEAMRYHSLVIDEETFPDSLDVTARTEQGELMAVRHKEFAVEGVQFHPESIKTDVGARLLENFMSDSYLKLLR